MRLLIYWVKEAQKLLKLSHSSEITHWADIMKTNAGQCFTTLEKVIYVEWGPLHWGLSLHLIKVVNLKIPMTVTAGLQQTVQNAGVGIIFLPLCDALSCTHTSAKFSLAFSLQVFFSCTVTPPLSAQVLKYRFWRTIPKPVSSHSTLGIPTVTLSSSACKLLPLSKSVLRLNHTIPVASSELRLKTCIPKSLNSGFAPKSLLSHSKKRNGLKDQKHAQKLVDAWCSSRSVFFKCCCVLSKEGKKIIHGVRRTKFLWVQ